MIIEAICKNATLTKSLSQIAFCGIRLSVESMNILNTALIKNKTIK